MLQQSERNSTPFCTFSDTSSFLQQYRHLSLSPAPLDGFILHTPPLSPVAQFSSSVYDFYILKFNYVRIFMLIRWKFDWVISTEPISLYNLRYVLPNRIQLSPGPFSGSLERFDSNITFLLTVTTNKKKRFTRNIGFKARLTGVCMYNHPT